MATPGTVNSPQPHDPQEEKVVTDEKQRVHYLFHDLGWKGGPRSFETWESDGGNVPAEEKVYLVDGELKKGTLAFLQWKWLHLKKRLHALFANDSGNRKGLGSSTAKA